MKSNKPSLKKVISKPLFLVFIFALIAAALLFISQAATSQNAIEPETGTITGNASKGTESANTSSYVLFKSGTGQPPISGKFTTLPVGAAVPRSDAACAASVRSAAEIRPTNNSQNHTRGTASSQKPLVTGNFTGTTDEIIQWGACKWGIDEDFARAQAAQESSWKQEAAGDRTYNAGTPEYCGAGQFVGSDGACPESVGILQVRSRYYTSYDHMSPWTSTAYNIDLTFADERNCYDGTNGYPLGYWDNYGGYTKGDLWGCAGNWFSGQWHDAAADQYICHMRGIFNQRSWESQDFKNGNYPQIGGC